MTKEETGHQFIEHPLPPLYDEDSRILILGSFPSIKTREAGFFYGHPQNRFWPMMSALLQIVPPLTAIDSERTGKIMLSRGIAIWDSIGACEIIGSSDSSIRHVVPNDFEQLFATSKISHIFCNGATAYRYYKKYQPLRPQIKVRRMPSTSPANAIKSLDALIADWSVILDYL